MASHDDVVSVTGPATADRYHCAALRADDDLGVDAAPVVLADGGDGLIVHGDQGSVDDPRPAIIGAGRSHCVREHWDQVVDDPVDGGLTRGEQCGQRTGGQVGTQVDQNEQYPYR